MRTGIQVLDITDPSNIRVDKVFQAVGPQYVQCQDNFCFSMDYKVDMANGDTVTKIIDSNSLNFDNNEFNLPIGNLIISTGKDRGIGVYAHQSQPDNNAP